MIQLQCVGFHKDNGACSFVWEPVFTFLLQPNCHPLMEVFTPVKFESITIVNQIGVIQQTKIDISLQQNTEQIVPPNHGTSAIFSISLPCTLKIDINNDILKNHY